MNASANVKCTRTRCFVPDRECAHGEIEYWSSCPHYVKDSKTETPRAPEGATDFPWTGNNFGLDDLSWLAARGRPTLFAPIGSQNAGKTTFLTSLYLGLCRGLGLAGASFAGSFTFGGWENLAAYLRYRPDGVGPAFPPHTVSGAKNGPGLLHLATRRPDARLRDLLLADAPGEWFRFWSINQAHDSAVGARWVMKHADGFLLFVDCDALSGSERGIARDELFKIAARLGAHIDKRPVAVVWAKGDKSLQPAFKQQVEERLRHALPHGKHFMVSAVVPTTNGDPAKPFLDVISWLINENMEQVPEFVIDTNKSEDPFLAYRGHVK